MEDQEIVRRVRNIVLVHGAFADGSGWMPVYKILKKRGYSISVVGNSNLGVEEDTAATQRVLSHIEGPVILVGHSYGGAIITKAGNAKNVVGLVYIAAFAPDEGETLNGLLSATSVDPKAGITAPENGFLWYDKAKYHIGFCADLPDELADFMADAQIPVAASAFGYEFSNPSWRHKPCWYCIATHDHTIPPELERRFAKRMNAQQTEIEGSHVIFISQPQKVAAVIEAAAIGALTKVSVKKEFHKMAH